MENQGKVMTIFYSILLALVSFFLFMFYKKVDLISDSLQEIKISGAVRDEQLKAIEYRITNLERTVSQTNANK